MVVKGLRNKDRNFWEGLKDWEVVVMSETWMSVKDWKGMKRRLPKGYEWRVQGAGKIYKKGRAMGGMIMGIRKKIMEKGTRIKSVREGLMGRVNRGGEERENSLSICKKRNGDGNSGAGKVDGNR